MRFRMISCEVFARLAYRTAAESPHTVDIEFTRLRSHVNPHQLRREIQAAIDSTPEDYDAILLGYGLCGNSTAGIRARSIPLVIPRAHDCCTIFLGSREAFLEHFGQCPSAQWYSACYYERLGGWYTDCAAGVTTSGQAEYMEELIRQYGEENARYIMEMMAPKNEVGFLTFIEIDGFDDPGVRDSFIEYARGSGKDTRFIKGSTRLIDALVNGDWNEEEYLIVPPGGEVVPVYDHGTIITASEKSQDH
ncbi:MAG TPA: DUF1638 domain-containing protein [Clostridiales bacterium]|mgnify:CR=1 FL=1|nr:DUF1638 domain-containing protein [Clostridiales bacterium]HPV01481.1 DUF1638 domain-containing protein [Clostridiales bacterium]